MAFLLLMNPSSRRANLDPVDDIVPYFARPVSAIIDLWRFYGDFCVLSSWEAFKLPCQPAISVFWPQPVSFWELLGRLPFSVLSSPFATIKGFPQRLCGLGGHTLLSFRAEQSEVEESLAAEQPTGPVEC
jgi:hypothetical protein